MTNATATYHPLTMYPSEPARLRATVLFDRRRLLYERKFHAGMVRYWRGQRDRILDLVSGYMTGYSIKLRYTGGDDIGNLFARNDENEMFIEHFREIQRIMVFKFGQKALDELYREGVLFDINRPAMQQWLATDLAGRAKLINKKTADVIQRVLNEGISKGEGADKLAARIREQFVDMTRGRAVRIARTEVGRAANTATLEGYKQAGAPEKEWISSRDEMVRDLHMAVDGQVVPLTDDFILGDGTYTQGPGLTGLPQHDIN